MMSYKSVSSRTMSSVMMLDSLQFDNRLLRELPIDSESRIFARKVSNAIFSRVQPTPVQNPQLVCLSPSALSLIGLPKSKADYLIKQSDGSSLAEKLERILAGNELLSGSVPLAQAYCGHQFGSFSGQLGDGAALLLGEIIVPSAVDSSETISRWELQLKGAGPTPYSRGSDGRKVLRSSIREFLCSEAMFGLGIPTTRAGSVTTSDTRVVRDPFYDGNAIEEKCTVVSRIAETFFRFGTFELFKKPADVASRSGPSAGNEELKKQLLDYIVRNYYEKFWKMKSSTRSAPISEQDMYARVYAEIVRRTATLVAQWQTVGFVHGVLNTDNMSIVGLTIDYGPFGFMEHFDPSFTPNGSDNSGRYCYSAQPEICKWNLLKLAEALDPILPLSVSKQILENAIAGAANPATASLGSDFASSTAFDDVYRQEYATRMRGKLGLLSAQEGDLEVIEDLFWAMEVTMADFTNTFLSCTEFVRNIEMQIRSGTATSLVIEDNKKHFIESLVSHCASIDDQKSIIERKLQLHKLEMDPRQVAQFLSLFEQVPDDRQLSAMLGGADVPGIRMEIMREKKKIDTARKLSGELRTLRNGDVVTLAETKRSKDTEMWKGWVEKYWTRLNLEFATETVEAQLGARIPVMEGSNPTFILRNWIAQEAIASAETNDFRKVETVLSMSLRPFSQAFNPLIASQETSCSVTSSLGETSELTSEERAFVQRSPEWASGLICTCSS